MSIIGSIIAALSLDADGNLTLPDGASFRVGDDTNYLNISSSGVLTLAGAAKRYLTLRAEINVDEIKKQGVPDQVQVGTGAFFGYSMPIYATDHEELYFRENVPGRWDGVSDVVFHVLCCLASAETPGETFKFQLSWNRVGSGSLVPTTVHDTTNETIVVDGTQFAAYLLEFPFNYDVGNPNILEPHDVLGARLRRVASDGDEVDGEIIVVDWHTRYQVNKMFKAL